LSQESSFLLIRKYAKGPLAEKLIESIMSESTPEIHQFLGVPLYVTLLFCAYRYRSTIPSQKHVFYAHVFEALFEAHDLTKDLGYVRQKHSKLGSNDFSAIMRRLGFWCLRNGMKLQFTKEELEIALQSVVAGFPGVNFNVQDFIRDLIGTVPLFVRDGIVYRWSHKSLQEYFAAMFTCHDTKGNQGNVLLAMSNNQNPWMYENILELCCDIDYPTFRGSVLLDVLRRLRECVRSQNAIPQEAPLFQYLKERLGCVFGRITTFTIIEEGPQAGRMPGPNAVIMGQIQNAGHRPGGWQIRENKYAVRRGSRSLLVVEQVSNFDCMLIYLVSAKEIGLIEMGKSAPKPEIIDAAMRESGIGANKVVVVDFDANNPLNKTETIKITNDLIRTAAGFSINVEESMKLLAEIEGNESGGLNALLDGMFKR
jgi:hypothetical protein